MKRIPRNVRSELGQQGEYSLLIGRERFVLRKTRSTIRHHKLSGWEANQTSGAGPDVAWCLSCWIAEFAFVLKFWMKETFMVSPLFIPLFCRQSTESKIWSTAEDPLSCSAYHAISSPKHFILCNLIIWSRPGMQSITLMYLYKPSLFKCSK